MSEKKRLRRKKDDYSTCVSDLLEMLKSSGGNGVTVEQIIEKLVSEKRIAGQRDSGSSAEELVSRMFKTLKKYGCRYSYIREGKKYILEDPGWTFPQELALTPMDQLALKLGWEMLRSSIQFNEGSGKLGENRNETFDALETKFFSFFKEKRGKLDGEILTGIIQESYIKQEVFINVVTAWIEENMLALNMKSGEKKYLMPSQLQLSPEDGWTIKGKCFSSGEVEEIQLGEIEKAVFQ